MVKSKFSADVGITLPEIASHDVLAVPRDAALPLALSYRWRASFPG